LLPCCWPMACLYPSAGPSAGLNCDVLLLEPVEEVDLRLAMPFFVEGAGLRMHADKKFIAIRHRVGLDLLAEAFVSAISFESGHAAAVK